MAAEKRIELSLGQEPGDFRLSVDGITIALNLRSPWMGCGPSQVAEVSRETAPAAREAGLAPTGETKREIQETGLSAEAEHYLRVSQEIYAGLGKLAKDINLSIQDLSLEEIIQTGMSSPGQQLDQARTQVTDVLQMTEQATLNIMNLVDEIRDDCQSVQARLAGLAHSGESEGDGEAAEALWAEVLSQARKLDEFLGQGQSAEVQVSEPGGFLFPLAEVLQLLLEFCANETVKQHLKAVQAKQEAVFRTAEAEAALGRLGVESPQEDGFHQLPVMQILEILKSHCLDDRVKDLLKKMSASAGKLFPVSALPLEAREGEAGFPEEVEAPVASGEAESLWQGLHENLKALARLKDNPPAAAAGDRQTTGDAVREVLGTVDHITGSLSRIVEALSFQDLSGQRLLKVLKIIRQLQVQVLTLLVGAGHKLGLSPDNLGVFPLESSQAREELDRLLHSFLPPDENEGSGGPEEQPLDQAAVNDLLTSMGF